MRFVGAADLEALLPMSEAVDVLERAFGTEPGITPQRSHVDLPDGTLLMMPSASDAGVGVKLVTLSPGNPERGLPFIHGVYVLFDPDTLAPSVIVDGAAMTGLRTGAVSAVATRHLARPDASRLVIFGAGTQAMSHLDAMAAVRDITEVVVVSRSRGPIESLIERARARGLAASSGSPSAVAGADIVCTCTTSSTPLFDGAIVPPGCHINAVGTYEPVDRELDTATVRRATVVVEDRVAALAEAGELALAIEEGAIDESHIAGELSDVVAGRTRRGSRDEVTVFKSVGVAFEDLAVARAIAERM